MELMAIFTALLQTVGLIEVLKNFIVLKNKRIWAVVMIPLGVSMTYAASYLPDTVNAAILVVCGSQLFYQSILQSFQKIVENLANKFS